ncbi:hypothetical protein [Clostridium beijerinckii]|uniref:Uncharacterized protein n=1 Tax=Clostridium beijerinckii TaxID=1520 RepID=A0AAW3W9F0_CLOBE|nr:hypothetical protein [Clostridium beijerinckii]MBC2456147.1 hypothetical protein [Clostridium beijerinckii]MBC2475432.1 hypothetical protein [Clostridium beijerinckii]NOV63459.1 hypothetical protein [Clostridium beijerinckii]NOV69575.1 hypothetical protein [Clostridium beijerinckii]NOW31516.1 hypothetical protein [Clostridium beijerinckii]
MNEKLNALSAKIKNKVGLCCSKGCFHRATVNVTFPQINVTRGLCDKHLLELQKMELNGFSLKGR